MISASSLPTLSIVIPVYNVKDYVLDAVNSVVNQSVTPHEVIIVDDGSTDNSGDLIEKNYSGLAYVKIIHTENQGLGEARNVGSRAATGDYVYYFDSDDLLEKTMVESFYKELSKNPDLDIYAFSAESFLDGVSVPSDSKVENKKLPEYRRRDEVIFTSGENAFNSISERNIFFPNAWLYVYKRYFFIESNITFKKIIHEDEEFTPRLFFAAGKTVVTDRILFRRRVRAGSIMQTARSEKNIIGYLRSIEALESLLSACQDVRSKKNIKARIINNIIKINSIKKSNNVHLSHESQSDFESILERHNGLLIKLASINYFSFRVCRYLIKKLNF